MQPSILSTLGVVSVFRLMDGFSLLCALSAWCLMLLSIHLCFPVAVGIQLGAGEDAFTDTMTPMYN